MRARVLFLLSLFLLLLIPTPSPCYVEHGDAGQTLTTRQYTDGALPLTEISGITEPGRADVDLYTLVVTDPTHFSARILSPANGRRWLYLFTATGVPILGAAPNIFPTPSGLLLNTVYMLAVTPFGISPYAASTRAFKWLYATLPPTQSNPSPGSLAIWPSGKFTSLPLADWGGTYSGDSAGPYTVALTGASEDYLSCDHKLVFQGVPVTFQDQLVTFGRCR